MVQPRQAHLARQDARLARYPGYQGSLLLCRRCLLRRRQDGARLAQAGQPSGDRGQIQCGGHAPATAKNGQKKKGRPKTYGQKKKLKSLLKDPESMLQVASPVYGEHNVILRYCVRDLLWRPVGLLVRFVAVIHPTRGACILMCTDTTLSAVDIIRLYGLRFKIETNFKQATRQIGSFAYHFWMKNMTPLRYHNGNQYLHPNSAEYLPQAKRKITAYHAFTQPGVFPQRLLPHLP